MSTISPKILDILPTKYRNFRQAWLSMDENRQNLSNLTVRLIDKLTNLNKNNRDKSAFFASYRTPRPSVNFNNPKLNQPKTKLGKSKVRCYSYRKRGNFARECRPWKNRRSRDNNNDPNDSIGYNAFSAEVRDIENCKENQWILDSGALVHMTYYLHSLDEFQKLDGSNNSALDITQRSKLKKKRWGKNVKIHKQYLN